MNDTFLHGIYLKNFRGIGPEGIRLAPFQKINLFAGANNSGKSTILHFLEKHAKNILNGQPGDMLPHDDVPQGSPGAEYVAAIAVPTASLPGALSEGERRKVIQQFDRNGLCWIRFVRNAGRFAFLDQPSENLESQLDESGWRDFASRFSGSVPRNIGELAGIVRDYLPAHFPREFPKIGTIKAIREIKKGGTFRDWAGGGVIEELQKLQNPDFKERPEAHPKFLAIQQFLQSVLGDSTARMHVPWSAEEIEVDMGGKVLPLSSLGTGIHQTIILAAICTVAKDQVVCIEEPELHLHPLLQRKLIRYLNDKTNNQYFITTHSAAILDSVPAAIFSVYMEGGYTKARMISRPPERYSLCKTLGYHASDLMQANSIVWVEGPSDRILVLRWIHDRDNSLIEGIDFAIMFYGGRLLSHLSGDPYELDEFIALQRLNRKVAIIMDSDKAKRNDSINSTKERLKRELDEYGYVWVTSGREIENYLPAVLVKEALKNIHSSYQFNWSETNQFARRMIGTSDGKKVTADKVKVARWFAKRVERIPVDQLDLKEKLDGLVDFIRSATVSS